jgi:hypothetical protein
MRAWRAIIHSLHHHFRRLARAVASRCAIDAKEFVEALEFYHRVRRRVRRATVVECVRRARSARNRGAIIDSARTHMR